MWPNFSTLNPVESGRSVKEEEDVTKSKSKMSRKNINNVEFLLAPNDSPPPRKGKVATEGVRLCIAT
jgi:hypothetical protein